MFEILYVLTVMACSPDGTQCSQQSFVKNMVNGEPTFYTYDQCERALADAAAEFVQSPNKLIAIACAEIGPDD